jgi:lipopolysaccharide biosynthesis glycosyltransferase
MEQPVRLVIGFDQREAIAYHVFCQSVLDRSSIPVFFIPLAANLLNFYREIHADGSNSFIYSRFLTPFLMGYNGWAIFADGDMICNADIKELWNKRDDSKAVFVVKHDYETKQIIKYLGNKNENYPRKNWSSLVLWNCAHPKNRILTPEFIKKSTGAFLHRFSWLDDGDIGDIDKAWNWLAIEYPENTKAKLIHYTLGTPCFKEYSGTSMSEMWFEILDRLEEGLER